MEDLTILFVIGAAGIALFGGFGSWVASQKGRQPVEGMMLGAVFGPLGVLIEALLPQGPGRNRPSKSSRSDFWSQPPEPTWLKEIDPTADSTENWLKELEKKR
ncbi:hypothetical protein [Singulisphaera acidiphila]|uniref:Uncharacterized protein n=1 Tax=Singulisphaera acidiphila (strain ATCC BAA-1392 / DSM 18658 / VKM B-2454 / MOB10) TaxID=886293 RepID=L0DGU9_SINAD|nr:hypothetical protein [Singulisphaera acidiphila]AGA28609.1 hypothetical protein Sinac_4419 [Singulisphaera acidiphila DSM 18658]